MRPRLDYGSMNQGHLCGVCPIQGCPGLQVPVLIVDSILGCFRREEATKGAGGLGLYNPVLPKKSLKPAELSLAK